MFWVHFGPTSTPIVRERRLSQCSTRQFLATRGDLVLC